MSENLRVIFDSHCIKNVEEINVHITAMTEARTRHHVLSIEAMQRLECQGQRQTLLH